MLRGVVGCLLVCASVPLHAADVGSLVAPGAEVVKVVGDCKFTEGPAYSPLGFLVFSDIPNSRIVRVMTDGSSSDFLKPSGKANGLAFDAAGHLYVCQGESGRVVRISGIDGKIEVLADKFDGKPFNSPNDLALDMQGGLYFTDPRYGQGDDRPQKIMGVYYISATGQVSRVIDSLERPNGILVTPDGKTLYVAEPNKGELWKYDIAAPGQVSEGKKIFTGDKDVDGGGPDGMALDAEGRIYATYKSIVVLDGEGSLVGRIPVPEQPANCTFGGPDGKTFYITARTSLYSLPMTVKGAPLAASGPRPTMNLGLRAPQVPVILVSDEQAEKPKTVEIRDIKLTVPPSWKQEPPANNLRLAQFKIGPAEGDKEPAELTIAFFQGDGGGIDANLKRWNDQFASEERKIKLTSGTSAQGTYYLSDLSGTYLKSAGGPFAGGKKTPLPGYRSLSVILEIKEKGNYFLRLTGPAKTVDQAAAAFRSSFGADAEKEKAYELK